MENTEIRNQITNDPYQVFICSCPAERPFSFARHAWFVCVENGVISRWEVLYKHNRPDDVESWGHLYKNATNPFQAIRRWIGAHGKHYPPERVECHAHFIGDTARKLIAIITSAPDAYTDRDVYRLGGPNCNSFITWALKQVPEATIDLSWRFAGK